MNPLRAYIRLIVEAEWKSKFQQRSQTPTKGTVAREFESSLTADVVSLLVARYAKKSSVLGALRWKYGPLPARTWGNYDIMERELTVNDHKTKELFKQQVQTIVHEIEHWNQHVAIAFAYGGGAAQSSARFIRAYKNESAVEGYRNNSFEVGARAFADEHLEDAMDAIGQHYGQKIEGGSIETVVEELLDAYVDNEEKPLTRMQLGTALTEYDMNSPENMKSVVAALRELGVKVA